MSTFHQSRNVNLSFDDAIAKVTAKLKEQDFGVLTEIDVKKTLKEKIGADFHKYRILGACNPQLAHKALSAEDKIGVMLPCNVVVQQKEDGGPVTISAINPGVTMTCVGVPGVAPIANEVASRLKTVIEGV